MKSLKIEDINYKIPEGPDEFELGKYEKVCLIIEKNTLSGSTLPFSFEDVINISSIATGIDPNLFKDSPPQFLDFVVQNLQWLFNLNTDEFKIRDQILMNSEVYVYQKDENITLREWVDIDEILKSFPKDEKLSALLCVRLRKKGEKYDSKLIEERKNKFKNLPISEVLPLVNFFLTNEKKYAKLMNLFSAELAMSHINMQQLLEWEKNGDGMQRLPRWQKKIYSKWIAYLTRELSKLSTFYLTSLTKPMPSTRTLIEKTETNNKII